MIEVKKVWLTDDAVHIQTADGREGHENFADYARLRNAPKSALEDYEIEEGGIHWNLLNEDLSFDGFFRPKNEKGALDKLFLEFPEISVSALARRLGMSQLEMAGYSSGSKTPSPKLMESILSELRKIGSELQHV